MSTGRTGVKLKAPAPGDHRGKVKVDPTILIPPMLQYDELLSTLASNAVSIETKQRVMQRAVSTCPTVNLKVQGKEVPFFMDSGSMVTLIWEGYFEKNVLPILKSLLGELSEAHSLFKLSVANNGAMPVSRYFEADINLVGFRVPKVGFLVVKDPNTLLEPQCATQLPGVIGCNLIYLGCEEFGKQYGFKCFKNFKCPSSVHPVVFLQFCTFFHQERLKAQTESEGQDTTNVSSLGIGSKDKKDPTKELDTTLGQVWVSDLHQPLCIPANSAKVVTDKTNKITKCLTCMVESCNNSNLPMGVVVNRTMVTPNKSKCVLVLLMNTN